MKTTVNVLTIFLLLVLPICFPNLGFSQCTPVSCLDKLPAYGGICDKKVADGIIGQEYSGVTSFHITSACVDMGMLDTAYTGVGAKMLKLHTFTISGLPTGLSLKTNRVEYTAPANGCGAISGKPGEAGLFRVKLSAKVDIRTWLISSACSGFLYLDVKNQLFDGTFTMLILPDARFSGPDTVYCIQDPPVTLTPTGTPGGTFSGPGVSGNSFTPSLAGPGVHQIKYEVSVQQGAATEPAKNSSILTVRVASLQAYFADNDRDGFGNPLLSVTGCNAPPGYVANDKDCNDANAAIHPNAAEIPGNGIDEDCNGSDNIPSALPFVSEGSVRWYPNPARDFIYVESRTVPHKTTLRICSADGLLWLEQTVPGQITKVNIGNLPGGVYLLLLSGPEGTIVSKLVKQ